MCSQRERKFWSVPMDRRVSMQSSLIALGLSAAMLPGMAVAAAVDWASATSGSWTDASKWNPTIVPGGADDAVIGATGAAYTVNLNANASINNLVLNSADAHFSLRSNANLTLNGTFSNIASYLLIADNSTQVSGPGTLSNDSTMLLANGGAINTTFVNNGVMDVQGDSWSTWTLDVGGVATNNGTINLTSYNDTTSLDNPILNFHQGLTNNGTIVMRTSTYGSGSGSGANSTTLNIGSGGVLVNQGLGHIILEGGGTRIINGTVANQGSLSAATNITLGTAGSDHSNSGTLTLLNNSVATIYGNSFTNLAGGVLGGIGTFNANATGILNQGTVSPGQSPGLLSITGDYTQAAGGILDIEIGGLLAGTEFDRLLVSGDANLAGTLNVTVLNGFDPAIGSTFDFLVAGSRLGTFDQLLFSGLTGKSFDITYGSNFASLTVVASAVPLPPSVYLFGFALVGLVGVARRR